MVFKGNDIIEMYERLKAYCLTGQIRKEELIIDEENMAVICNCKYSKCTVKRKEVDN